MSALAQRTRLEAYRTLAAAGPDGMMAGELASALGIRPNLLSAHIAVLTAAGLVAAERSGRNLICRARAEPVSAVSGMLGKLVSR